jgi:hypothetical protein
MCKLRLVNPNYTLNHKPNYTWKTLYHHPMNIPQNMAPNEKVHTKNELVAPHNQTPSEHSLKHGTKWKSAHKKWIRTSQLNTKWTFLKKLDQIKNLHMKNELAFHNLTLGEHSSKCGTKWKTTHNKWTNTSQFNT